jgi:hypothetical protein
MGTQAFSQTPDPTDPNGLPISSGVSTKKPTNGDPNRKAPLEKEQVNNTTKWPTSLESHPLLDVPWESLVVDYNKSFVNPNGRKTFRGLAAAGETKTPIDQFQYGDSYFGVRTDKMFQIPPASGQPDCASDEECADYSVLPKARQSKMAGKSIRKPYVGLSITTPIK